MTSELEQSIARALRSILQPFPDGALIADSEELRNVLVGLEFYLPCILQEVHGEWGQESLDGILPSVARKPAPGELELFAICILITDQTVAPIKVCLQIDPTSDEISWLECRIGQSTNGGMKRTPYNADWPTKHVLAAAEQIDSIDWFYKVMFGQKRNK